MKIKFVGAVGKVTGSCTWCIHPRTGTQFLVDCGAVQGGMHQEAENNMPFPFEPNRLKFVLLTHAHMDHCGRIPQLYAQGFRGKVICTAATARLARLQLDDAHTQAKKRAGNPEVEESFPIYPGTVIMPGPDPDWFYHIDGQRDNFEFGKALLVDDDLFVAFRRSSHMLGCCSITVFWAHSSNHRKSICFSGDVGPIGGDSAQVSMMEGNQAPHRRCPYLVVESTYGGKEPRKDEHKHFDARVDALSDVVSKYRTVVIPCFSMQRTQEVLLDIWGMLHGDPEDDKFSGLEVVLDSSLADKACEVFRDELKEEDANGRKTPYLDRMRRFMGKMGEFSEALGGGGWIVRAKIRPKKRGKNMDRRSFFDPSDGKRRIVVTSSGMCHAGPVLSYLPLLEEPDAAFVITGFQNTHNGKRLSELAKKQAGETEEKWDKEGGEAVRLFVNDRENKEENFLVRAGVFNLGPFYSGHADIGGLVEYIFDLELAHSHSDADDIYGAKELPKVTLFLNHGDNPSRNKLRKRILSECSDGNPRRRKIAKVEIPHMTNPFFDLERGEWEERPAELVRRLIKTLARRGDGARPAPRRRDAAKKSGNGV